MRKLILAISLIACGSNALAQTVVDDSAKNVSSEDLPRLLKSFKQVLADPFSAQVSDLAPYEIDPKYICGRVNGKNKLGGYVGFQPFRYTIETGEIFIHANTGCR